MTAIAQALDETIGRLDPERAKLLEELVRAAMARVAVSEAAISGTEWPSEYFERTAGVFANEPFERPDQGEYPDREDW